MRSRTASCACGQLRIEVHGEPRGVGVCHCLACQRRTGSVFAALASFAAPYEVSGTATEYVRVGDQGASSGAGSARSAGPPCSTPRRATSALRQRLQTQAAAVATLADEWAIREAPISFKDFEKALRDLVFAFARVAIMLFLALREEHLMRAYPSQMECAGRRSRRAPPICPA
jgi:hypothetical protein